MIPPPVPIASWVPGARVLIVRADPRRPPGDRQCVQALIGRVKTLDARFVTPAGVCWTFGEGPIPCPRSPRGVCHHVALLQVELQLLPQVLHVIEHDQRADVGATGGKEG